MEMLFLITAILGGTVFILQFVLAVIGFGAEDLDFGDAIPDDIPDDIPDFDAGDVHGSTSMFAVLSFRTVGGSGLLWARRARLTLGWSVGTTFTSYRVGSRRRRFVRRTLPHASALPSAS